MATQTLIGVIAGAICILCALAALVLPLLERLGKLRPSRWWGRSVLAGLLVGIGCLAMGAGILMDAMVGADSPFYMWGTLVFLVALVGGILVERRHRGK